MEREPILELLKMSKVNATELAKIYNDDNQYKTYRKAINYIRNKNAHYYIDRAEFFGENCISPIHFLEYLGYTSDFLNVKSLLAVEKMIKSK